MLKDAHLCAIFLRCQFILHVPRQIIRRSRNFINATLKGVTVWIRAIRNDRCKMYFRPQLLIQSRYTHVIPSARILEEGVPGHGAAAGLQIRPQGIDTAELEQIRLLDFRSTELLQLLQPTAQHRLDALVYLRARARMCDKVRLATK